MRTLALSIHRIPDADSLRGYADSLKALLGLYRTALAPALPDEVLLRNTAACMPWLWLVTDATGRVYAVASLTDFVPGRHVFIHGVTDSALRRHPVVDVLAWAVLAFAFVRLGVRKVKAEFETDNRAVLGFCRRWGFVREALFGRDLWIRGEWRDVAVYSLTGERFMEMKSGWPAGFALGQDAIPGGHFPAEGRRP